MSQIVNLLEGNQDNSTSLVFFDSKSVDSIFGAGIVKYICENITDVSDSVEVVDIASFNRNNINKETYINVSFIGCIPSDDDIIYVSNIYEESTLFVLCDKIQYNKVKSLTKNVSIEYSVDDSCSLNLYKIAFGEFEDVIPNIFKYISNLTLREFDEEYIKGIKFEAGFLKNYSDFSTFYSVLDPILSKVADEEEQSEEPFSTEISDGESVLNSDIEYLLRNLNIIKADTILLGENNKAIYVFSNGKVSDNIMNSIEGISNFLFTVYRYNSAYWNIDLFKHISSTDLSKLETNNARIEEINEIRSSGEAENDNELVAELNRLNKENQPIQSLINFNCGTYCKNKFKGFGNTTHGYGLISNEALAKILTNKKI